MTIRELIDLLNEYEDKEQKVVIQISFSNSKSMGYLESDSVELEDNIIYGNFTNGDRI